MVLLIPQKKLGERQQEGGTERYWGYIGVILGLPRDNGKENGTTGIIGVIQGL